MSLPNVSFKERETFHVFHLHKEPSTRFFYKRSNEPSTRFFAYIRNLPHIVLYKGLRALWSSLRLQQQDWWKQGKERGAENQLGQNNKQIEKCHCGLLLRYPFWSSLSFFTKMIFKVPYVAFYSEICWSKYIFYPPPWKLHQSHQAYNLRLRSASACQRQ